MKLRSQIVFAQLPSVAVIILISIFFIIILNTIERKSDQVLLADFKNIVDMQKFNESIEELNLLNINNIQNSLKDESQVKILENKVAQHLFFYEENLKENSEESKLIVSLRQKWELYKKLVNENSSNLPDLEKIYKEIKSITLNIIGLNMDDLVRKKNNLSTFISDILLFVILGPAFILIFSFFASWFLTGLLLNPLDKMAEMIRQVGKEGDTTYIHIKGSDEIENLSEEFNLMTTRLEEYHKSSLGHVLREYQTLKSALDLISKPILLFNSTKELIYYNKAAQNLFDISDNNNFNFFNYTKNNVHETLHKIVNDVLTTKASFIPEKSDDTLSILKENTKTFFLPFAYPIKKQTRNHDIGLAGVIVIFEGLMGQNMSDSGKTEIYETLIHEFKSPLSDVHMAIHICLEEGAGPLTNKQKEILYAARDKCELLEKLCQDLLNFSQINQLTQHIEKTDIDLSEIVKSTMTSLQLDTEEKGIFIEVDEPPFLSKINANRNQIEILIENLLRNALDFAPPKSKVKINLRETNQFIEFSVNNEGAVIPSEHRKNIFKKYFKIPGQNSEGAGIGLYISKSITDSLMGKIGFKSTKERGTTFWFHIPFDEETKTS